MENNGLQAMRAALNTVLSEFERQNEENVRLREAVRRLDALLQKSQEENNVLRGTLPSVPADAPAGDAPASLPEGGGVATPEGVPPAEPPAPPAKPAPPPVAGRYNLTPPAPASLPEGGGVATPEGVPSAEPPPPAPPKGMWSEMFWGLRLISILGGLLILFGVFTFGRDLYLQLNPALQCAVIFALGLLLMGAAELLHRKGVRGGFTLALTSVGAAILFLGAALGHLTLGVFSPQAALAACGAGVLLTFLAALRYDAQLIGVFALVGGYIPLITLNADGVLYGVFYFTVLSLFTLLVATRKSWRVMRMFGLFAGMLAEVVMLTILSGWRIESGVLAAMVTAVGGAIAISFLAYLVLPVYSAWSTRTSIRPADIVLLSCNLLFRYLLGLYTWNTAWELATSWSWEILPNPVPVAAFVAVCCLVMAVLSERHKPTGVPEADTGSLRALFFITSVTFSSLFLLHLLSESWFAAGWLIEAAGLAIYGIVKNRRRFSIAATAVGAAGLLAFWFGNLGGIFLAGGNPLFPQQYLLVTFLAALVGAISLRAKPESAGVRRWLYILRCAAAVNIWLYVFYALGWPLAEPLAAWLGSFQAAEGYAALLTMVFGYLFALALPRLRPDPGFRVAASIIGVVNTLMTLGVNPGLEVLEQGGAVGAGAFVLYIIANFASVARLGDSLVRLVREKRFPRKYLWLLVSGFAVILLAQNLSARLHLGPASLILTLLFGLTALGWVLYGFLKREALMRRCGLILAFCATFKLLVLDLRFLDTTLLVIAYLTGGAVLLGISFTYQYFSRKLKQAEEAEASPETQE